MTPTTITEIRHIARCPRCKIVQSYMVEKGQSAFRLCPGCKKMMQYFPVKGKYNPNHKCNAKCLNAVGPACECECAGANHGSGHSG